LHRLAGEVLVVAAGDVVAVAVDDAAVGVVGWQHAAVAGAVAHGAEPALRRRVRYWQPRRRCRAVAGARAAALGGRVLPGGHGRARPARRPTLQASHRPPHAELQHTPSAQRPLTQSSGLGGHGAVLQLALAARVAGGGAGAGVGIVRVGDREAHPRCSLRLQAWHGPHDAEPQQTLSTQLPDCTGWARCTRPVGLLPGAGVSQTVCAGHAVGVERAARV